MTDNEIITDIESVNDKINEVSMKLTQEYWNVIEKRFSDFELRVVECLKLLGSSNGESDGVIKKEYRVMGEELYLSNRNLLERHPLNFVDPITVTVTDNVTTNASKKKGKPGANTTKTNAKVAVLSSKDMAILENAKNNAKTHILTTLSELKGDFQPKYAFNSDIIEIKGIGLMYAAWYLYNNNIKYRKKKDLQLVFTIMVSIEKFTKNCKDLKGKSLTSSYIEVSQTLLKDLDMWLTKLKTIYTYDGFAVCDYAPELLIYTEYDEAIPMTGVKPRSHQKELIKRVKDNFDDGFLFSYNPPMGSGKTAVIISLCTFIEKIRKERNVPYQLIFACNLTPVRDHAASLCYNASIKFGIGSRDMKDSDKYVIKNHFLCGNTDIDRVVIITSPEVAYNILKNDMSGHYLLFLDEPTVGADCLGSETLKTNMAVLTVAPKRTILSSATFPDINLMPNIKEYFEKKHNSIIMGTIYSNEIQIGCDIKTLSFNTVVPHLKIKTKDELIATIDTIEKNPFLGRTYTSDVARYLYKNMIDNGITDIKNVNDEFQSINNMTSDIVRGFCMEMLYKLSTCSDSVIESVCSRVPEVIEKVKLNDIDLDTVQCTPQSTPQSVTRSIWDDEPNIPTITTTEEPTNIDYHKLLTTQAWIMQNTTLIATTEPMSFVQKYFYDFVHNDIYNHQFSDGTQYKNSRNIIKIYENDTTELEKHTEQYEKSIGQIDKKKERDKSKKSNTTNSSDNGKEDTHNRSDTIKNITKIDIDKNIQNFSTIVPQLRFPEFAHINTKKHMKKYSRHHYDKMVSKNVRIAPSLEIIPWNTFNISDELLTLLFAGVGVYSMMDRTMCPNYLKTVLEMASDGKLAYIVSDVSICYGTNYPINRVIVTDDFSEKHSINTLFQLFGRAGRVGRSWIAVVYVPDSVVEKLIEYTRKKSSSGFVEAENMKIVFEEYRRLTNKTNDTFLNATIKKYIKNEETTEQNELCEQTEKSTDVVIYKNSKKSVQKTTKETTKETIETNDDGTISERIHEKEQEIINDDGTTIVHEVIRDIHQEVRKEIHTSHNHHHETRDVHAVVPNYASYKRDQNQSLQSNQNYSHNQVQNYSQNRDQNYHQNRNQNYSRNNDQNYPQNRDQNYSRNNDQKYPQNRDQKYPQNRDQNYSRNNYQNRDQNYYQNRNQNHSQNRNQNYSQNRDQNDSRLKLKEEPEFYIKDTQKNEQKEINKPMSWRKS